MDGLEAWWFWYDSDVGYDLRAYAFFLVYQDRIARERVVVFDDHEGFDPSVFKHCSLAEPSPWLRESAWREADEAFWYRKFYGETRTGQLMVLRSDTPLLHYYPEGRWRPDVAFTVLASMMRMQFWLLVLLGLIGVFLLLWR